MSILVGGVRSRRRGSASVPSVREVCLVGMRRPVKGWTAGEQVRLSGRVYRIEATLDRAGQDGEGPREPARYVHLAPGPGQATG